MGLDHIARDVTGTSPSPGRLPLGRLRPVAPAFGPTPGPSPSPHLGGVLPGGPRCPNTGSGCGWQGGWRGRGGQEDGPAGGRRAPQRGRCCRQLPGDQEPRRLACAQPGVGCSAGAAGSAAGWHGRCPAGRLAWGSKRHQAPHLSLPFLGLLPGITVTQWPLENGAVSSSGEDRLNYCYRQGSRQRDFSRPLR
jgi:hypothetical protein